MQHSMYSRRFRTLERCMLTVVTFVLAWSPVTTSMVRAADVDAPAEQAEFSGFTVPGRNVKVLPAIKTRIYKVDTTAYTSSVEECDSDPFITADGSTTRDGIIATNFLPFGTKVRFPALFGDKVFEVHDRMNTRWDDRTRYAPRIDVWMEKKQDMRQFGIHRNIEMEIMEMGDGSTQWGKRAIAMK